MNSTINTTLQSTNKRPWVDESKRKSSNLNGSTAVNSRNPNGLRILSGDVEFGLYCARIIPDPGSILMEIFGDVHAINSGESPLESIILLRNGKGPVLQLSYYAIDFPLEKDLKKVRCICRLTSTGRFQAFKIMETPFCDEYIVRLQAISRHILKKLIQQSHLV